MIDWNALHTACVDRVTFYKEATDIGRLAGSYKIIGKYLRLARRYEALLEFIDTRVQTSINQPI